MAEEKALRMIATSADGSLRDALSYLEPCLAAGKEIKTEFVEEFLGKSDNSAVMELCESIGRCDAQDVLACVETVSSRGRNLTPFIENAIKAMRDMLVVTITGSCKSDFEGEDYEKLKEIALLFTSEKLLYAIKSLSEAVTSAKYMTNPRVIFEAALVRLCVGGNDTSTDALLARISELEKRLDSGNFKVVKEPAQKKPAQEKPKPEIKKEPIPQSELVDKIKKIWPEVMQDMAGSIVLYAALENVTLREESGKLALTFPDAGGRELKDMVKDGIDDIKKSIERHTQNEVDVVTRLESDFSMSIQKEEHDLFDDIIKLPITNTDERKM